jgi:3-oxoacyl-[acyl-carrier-protein] synthase II
MKRVVVTGMGIISPLGVGIEHNWNQLMNCKNGISAITAFPTDGLDSKIAGQIPHGEEPGQYNQKQYFSNKEIGRNDPFILHALAATSEALESAGWKPESEEEQNRTGVLMGSGVGGFQTVTKGALDFADRGAKGISPFFIPAQIINLASGQIAIKYGFKGPNYGVVSACSSGADSIASGARSIQLGEADVVVTGGTDAIITPLAIAGFCRARAMSTGYNDRPQEASRPFDTGRDGFVMSEGAGILILEEYEHAKKRGAEIIAELKGYASVSDAYHITATHPEGTGEQRALRRALSMGNLEPTDIDYINAHATSTPVGDVGELNAIHSVFKDNKNVAISSTKSAIGHTLGAAGAIESIYSICAIKYNSVPPTLNLENPEPGFEDLNLVPNQPQEKKVRYALSNAFGFGSAKTSVVFGAID